ncbi:MAG: GAF domain-containing protein [Acidobacteriota bacterium]|jgi:adenylate cyclase|nr:GAF domain-containing protein [Acidobacteriota bacterium]
MMTDVSAILKITEASGKTWEVTLVPNLNYSIGRAKGNDINLNDRRVSRRHAHIKTDGKNFTIVDGYHENGEIKRSVNKVYVNAKPVLEKVLEFGDRITIGTTQFKFDRAVPVISQRITTPQEAAKYFEPQPSEVQKNVTEIPTGVDYDDKPIGTTQLVMSANEIIEKSSKTPSINEYLTPGDLNALATPEEIKILRRKAQILEMLYEMSKTLGTVFDLEEIFEKATDLIFRVTPSERVVALLADETLEGKILDYSLYPVAAKAREGNVDDLEKLTISRTITQKVMREKVALLSQDARADKEFSGSESIVVQGVRSTICAPLVTESNVHGVVYADRLDPFATFTQDDLELISAVAAQTAVAVETIKAHKRLAREEVARANYSRFMPEYVVKQLLEHPDSFQLGGVNETITVLFADIRGFTALSETQNPEKVVGLLNRYFTAMSEIIFEHGGTLDKYLGDGLMALFGAPKASSHDADNAVKTAIAMQKRISDLNAELKREGFQEISIGIGLHTGVATIGYIGSEQRSEYTAIGDTVNLASRLESSSKGGEILISKDTAKACSEPLPIKQREPLQVKNRVQPVSLFEVKWN